MENTYPAGPAAVPADFAETSRVYRQRAWLAVAGFAGFFAFYLTGTGWFLWTAYRLLDAALAGGGMWGGYALGSVCSALLAVFLLKPLFSVRRGEAWEGVEATAQRQPGLFEFIERLTEDAQVSRPQRVFLTPRVTVTVFQDLSIFNLVLPAKKHLEIGLPVVNSLSLSELKAVLAHEMGRFSPQVAAPGRWASLASQVAANIVTRRGRLDALLDRLSRKRVRIAWVSWLPTLVVSSIRALVEISYRDLVSAQRNFSRGFELQADLVAVSLCGSDTLLRAIHRLRAADDAWDRTLAFGEAEQREGRGVTDLFTIQARLAELLPGVLGKPDAVASAAGAQDEALRRANAEARPPRMWSARPTVAERESNARRVAVAADDDGRSAWELFEDAAGVRERVSALVAKQGAATPIEESLRRLNAQFERAHLNRLYRGAYLDRSVVRHASRPADLYDAPPDMPIAKALGTLYPESLGLELERLRDLEEELASLQAWREARIRFPGGVAWYRGRELRWENLPHALILLREEIAAVTRSIHDHERRSRAAHLAAAARLKAGWEDYLRGLARALHYADHTEANLRDAHARLTNVVDVVTADRRMNERELQQLLAAATDVDEVLRGIHENAKGIALDRTLARRTGTDNWAHLMGEYPLPVPTEETISTWLRTVDACVRSASQRLGMLKIASLEQLLLSESQVARFVRQRLAPGAAPPASRVPAVYPVLVPGQERPRESPVGWWERFQANPGPLPTAARVTLALVIIGAVVVITETVGRSTVTIYNGLAREITVDMGNESVDVMPMSSASVNVARDDRLAIETRTAEGVLIERFTAQFSAGQAQPVYNVANASLLVEWTALYGQASGDPDRVLGMPRWTSSDADFLFEDPPAVLQTQRGGAARRVLSAMADSRPEQLLSLLQSDAEQAQLITTHARWDSSEWKHTGLWLLLASERERFDDIITHRLATDPTDALTLRMEQDATPTPQARERVCMRHRDLADAAPENPDLQYISARCIENEREKKQAFLARHRAWPENGWLTLAAGYTLAEEGRWDQALKYLLQASHQVPALSDYLAVDVARIRRMLAPDGKPPLEDLQRDSVLVGFLQAIETGQGLPESPLLAYQELARGNLDVALEKAAGAMEAQARVLRLVAASDGASPAMVERALALPLQEGIDQDTIWAALGLAARQQATLDPYFKSAEQLSRQDAPAIRRFLESVRRGDDPQASEALLEGVHIKSRAQAFSMALTVLGRKAPAQWREKAKRLLFAYERPYFE